MLQKHPEMKIACHEFRELYGIITNDHAANARVNELRRACFPIKSQKRENKEFNEYWYDIPKNCNSEQMELLK